MPTTTYKTNTFILQAKAPLNRSTASKRAVLTETLQGGTVTYPNRMSFRGALESLYGTVIGTDVYKKGEHHIMSFRLDVPNGKFLKGSPPLTEQAVAMFSEMIFAPARNEDDQLNPEVIQEEKRALKQKITSISDDKMRYANKRLIDTMCENEAFSTHVYGTLQDVEDITPADLTEYYESFLETDQLDLYVSGDLTLQDVEAWIELFFGGVRTNHPDKTFIKEEKKSAVHAKEVTEVQDVQQGKLHIGYRTGVVYGDQDYFALLLMNGLFGGFSHSKLFVNVREKESLAYYAASRLETLKGLMIVMAGIQSDQMVKTKKIIFEQLEAMRAGDFSDNDLDQTRAVLKNQWLETLDSQRGRIELAYNNEFTINPVPVDQWFDELEKVTREDLQRVAQGVMLDTVFFLKGKVDEA
ncbi:EF-P 5-aminopentanol modification-associated protein YfmF [Salisediminibacterium beveridgei]|nr:pitrilysin family protein [Salisediminibacterium beveridgei]